MGTRKNLLIASSLVTGLLLVFPWLLAGEYKIIENPKANMVEKEYVKLVKIKEINEDLGKDEYLFKPALLTLDNTGNLYIYDLLQTKIYKLDSSLKFLKTISGKGQGPGEISPGSFGLHCYIKIGRDGKLYVNDAISQKIMTFNKDGDFLAELKIREVKFSKTFGGPVVDEAGGLYIPGVEKDEIALYDGNFKKRVTIAAKDELLTYLFEAPPFHLPYIKDTCALDITKDSVVLFYFQNSSVLYMFKKGKQLKNFSILPGEALENYREVRDSFSKSKKKSYIHMFPHLFVDDDEADRFYLSRGIDKKGNIYALYQFDLNGHLLKVFYIEADKGILPLFLAKKNYRFYVIEIDQDGEFRAAVYI
jgi:hypothetical protein